MKVRKFNEKNGSDSSSRDYDIANYKEYFYRTLECFLEKLPEDHIWDSYINETDGHIELQDFINMNLKEKFKWSTGIGILETCENLIKEAYGNGNIK
jgi:hypothetical protein